MQHCNILKMINFLSLIPQISIQGRIQGGPQKNFPRILKGGKGKMRKEEKSSNIKLQLYYMSFFIRAQDGEGRGEGL